LGIEKAIFGKPAPKKKPTPGELAKTAAPVEPEPETKPQAVTEVEPKLVEETKAEITPIPTSEENPSKA